LLELERIAALPAHLTTPIPQAVVSPGPDPLSSLVLVFTLIASAAAIPATAAAVVAAIYAFKGYRAAIARPKLIIPVDHVAVGTGVTIGAFEMDIGISIKNDRATTEGVYIDIWLEEPDLATRRPSLIVDMRQNPDWLRCDSTVV
jgi:hypothetical protein